jgi:zinc protease
VGEATSPDHLADVALADALYPPGDPDRRFASPQSVGSLTLADVRAWYESAYRPDLATIVVVGDVTPARAKAEIERYFGSWRAHGAPPVTEPPRVEPNAAASVVVPATGRVQSSVTLEETASYSRNSNDWDALQVANAILTGGFYQSLLYHDLREVHGYAYSITSEMSAKATRALISVTYGCDPKNIVPAQQLVVRDLVRLQTSPVAAERLAGAKALLMGQVPIREASYGGIAGELLGYVSDGLSWNQSRIDARRELAVTASDLETAMRRWVRPRGFVRVVTGPGPT